MSSQGSSTHHNNHAPHTSSYEYDPHRALPAQTRAPLSPPLTPEELKSGTEKDTMLGGGKEGGGEGKEDRRDSDAVVMGYEPAKEHTPQHYFPPSSSSSLNSTAFSTPTTSPPTLPHRTSSFEPYSLNLNLSSSSTTTTPLNGTKDNGYAGFNYQQPFYNSNGMIPSASTSKDSGFGGSPLPLSSTGPIQRQSITSPTREDLDDPYHPSSSTAHHRVTASVYRQVSPNPNTHSLNSPNSLLPSFTSPSPGYHSSTSPYVDDSHAYTSGRLSPSREKGFAHLQQMHPLTTSSPTMEPPKVGFTDSPAYWLGLYFFFNLGLTLFNKVVLVSFPFPYTLTGLHALSGCLGCYMALEQGAFVPARLTPKENMIMAAFSVLYTINIAVSNLSLQLVTVPFHQVVRASTPLFTILISTIFLRTRFSTRKLISLLPVVAGVGFATYGDYYFTVWGLILTLIGTFLAALKTVVTNVIQTGGGGRLKLHPLDLLMRMSPLAFIQCVVYGWWSGELERVRRYGATEMTRGKAIALLVNGVIAFGLNIVSFTANKKAGALTMTVSANCKQVLTIAIAVVLFDLKIAVTNGIGILLTLVGGAWYAYIEYLERSNKRIGKFVDR